MAKLTLTDGGFTLIPEGTYVFTITKVEYKEKFGKITITLKTDKGQTMIEHYNIKTEGGINAFSYMAKCSLNDFECEEIDPVDLVGLAFVGDVVHSVVDSKDKPGQTLTFANIKNKQPLADQEDAEEEAEEEVEEVEDATDLSFLDD